MHDHTIHHLKTLRIVSWSITLLLVNGILLKQIGTFEHFLILSAILRMATNTITLADPEKRFDEVDFYIIETATITITLFIMLGLMLLNFPIKCIDTWLFIAIGLFSSGNISCCWNIIHRLKYTRAPP